MFVASTAEIVFIGERQVPWDTATVVFTAGFHFQIQGGNQQQSGHKKGCRFHGLTLLGKENNLKNSKSVSPIALAKYFNSPIYNFIKQQFLLHSLASGTVIRERSKQNQRKLEDIVV